MHALREIELYLQNPTKFFYIYGLFTTNIENGLQVFAQSPE